MTEREKVLEILNRVGFKKKDYHLSEDNSVLSFHYPVLEISFNSKGNITDVY